MTDREDSAHLMAPRIRCESYFACAETDKWAPREIVEKLQAALVAAGTPHRIEWYPGAEHGFVFPQRAGIYHQRQRRAPLGAAVRPVRADAETRTRYRSFSANLRSSVTMCAEMTS